MNKELLIKELNGKFKGGQTDSFWLTDDVLEMDMDIKNYQIHIFQLEKMMKENEWDEVQLAEKLFLNASRDMFFHCDARIIDSWKKAKSRLRLCCARKDYHDFSIEECILSKDFLDVKLFVRILVEDEYMYDVPKNYQQLWNKTEEEIFEIAKSNSFKEITITPIDVSEGDNCPLYHMTTNKRKFGAVAMAYKEKLMELADIIGGNIIVMPQSCQDVVVAPRIISGYDEDGKLLKKNMVNIFKQLQKETNEQIPKMQYMTDNVYEFLRGSAELRVCEKAMY